MLTDLTTAKQTTDHDHWTSVRENGESIWKYGTVRRGNGTVTHYGGVHWIELDGYRTNISCYADCNGNGSNTGHDFQEGQYRLVTCKSCLRINAWRFK